MTYGYARCSTNADKQDISRQTQELAKAGAVEIRMEYVHGDSNKKPVLDELMKTIQPGDSLIVSEVSRLARSTQQLCALLDLVQLKHIKLEILGSITLDCRGGELDPMSKAFLQMAGVFAELELQITRSRVRSGMQNAKAKGVKIGRPGITVNDIPAEAHKAFKLVKNNDISVSEAARMLRVSRTTVYRWFDILEG